VVELVVQANRAPPPASSDVYIVVNGTQAAAQALSLAERLRDALPQRSIALNLGGGNFKAQFRRADRSGAALAVILGDDELSRGVAALKPLRAEAGQTECPIEALPQQIETKLTELRRR
jgi:histidyl-tRNA synthetase